MTKISRYIVRSLAFSKFSSALGFAVTSHENLQNLRDFQNKAILSVELSNLIDGKHVPFLLNKLEHSCGQILQDLVCLIGFNQKKNGFFVEVGVGDGELHSNSLLLENIGWEGILIEPNPIFHKSLDKRNAVLVKAAAADSRRVSDFLAVQEFPTLSTLNDYKDSDAHKTLRLGKTISVDCKPLDEILREFRAPQQIDYMSVDTEGSEFSILQNFDFNLFHIGFLTVEHNHTKAKGNLDKLMKSRNFFPILDSFSRWDRFYVNCEIIEKFSSNFGPGKLV